MPGDETEKTITVKNIGNICEKVRISITETWTDSEGNPLSGEFSQGKKTAILNLVNTNEWIYNNGYYYNGELAPGATTSSFLDSVIFNEEYTGDITCTTVNKTSTCN